MYTWSRLGSLRKGMVRFVLSIYLLYMAILTIWWYEKSSSGWLQQISPASILAAHLTSHGLQLQKKQPYRGDDHGGSCQMLPILGFRTCILRWNGVAIIHNWQRLAWPFPKFQLLLLLLLIEAVIMMMVPGVTKVSWARSYWKWRKSISSVSPRSWQLEMWPSTPCHMFCRHLCIAQLRYD